MINCHFCEEEKEIGKELFWCPRLRSSTTKIDSTVQDLFYYGSWVCLTCCKNTFFKAIYDKHSHSSWIGSCAECDFPVGAILEAKKTIGYPEEHDLCVRKRSIKREEKEIELFLIEPLNHGASRYYYDFKWSNKTNTLKLKKRNRDTFNYLATLVLECEKLPTRIVILLEDTLTYEPLSWYELSRYYWSFIGSPQHFKEEKWMDQAPVIIGSGYLNGKKLNLNSEAKKKIDVLNKILFKK